MKTSAISCLFRRAVELEAELLGASGEARGDLARITQRLRRSVIRPLGQIAGPADDGTPPADEPGDLAGRLRSLAVEATRIRMAHPAVPLLLEATAALQDLACRVGADDAEAVAELSAMQAPLTPSVQSQTDGPYLVSNVATMLDWLGEPLPTRPQMALCRCGRSELKPFCDGTHAEIGFTGEKQPDRIPDRRDTYEGQQVTIFDNRGICQHSGYCSDRLATVFRVDAEPFVAPSGGRMDEIIRAVRDCPSGALSYAIDGIEAREEVDFHGRRAQVIVVSKDGPYRLTGALPLLDGEGDPEPTAEGSSCEHFALCRCGQSQNKPFCSGMHWYVDFKDPVDEPDRQPTIFEWAGGVPGLTRMTRIFYERYVPEDPLLAPLFATMSPDHPQRVAAWLGEVFGGPTHYSEAFGGYPRMLSQHIGKGLTEEKRARWVQLILRAAQDAGLPADPEFRSAFSSYIEWGSRLALENSQPGAKPPGHMPMPHWDWYTAAGPPGSRNSALEPVADADAPAVLPHPDEPVSFETHVKTLFRQRDRQSMSFAFDLWAYDEVKRNAPAILERLRDGSMPCDGAWPAERIDAFERWVSTGMRP